MRDNPFDIGDVRFQHEFAVIRAVLIGDTPGQGALIEALIGKKIFLDLYVRVDKDWRDDESKLRRFGYFD